ncbi:MAG TPA: maleylpyruvate isomerase family mycothiol-dependent enzyme [Candidatus Dormibacteraeota bacterium]|jgi:uncharacterized protein (TIGR03083 family)|nr:maleylpyruvate isomerase family mycothiol-dependent enzyme [Candidatus Dormibacteraeota bacterium]
MAAISEEHYRAAFTAQTDGIARIAETADPGTPIATCPGWTLAHLIQHVGKVHRRAAATVRRGERVPDEELEDTVPPAGGEGDWLRAGAERVVEEIGRRGLDAPAWLFARPGTAGLWLRRVTHETTVHHADAAFSCGREWSAPPDLAADGVTEALEFFCSPGAAARRPSLKELRGRGETLHLHATDEGLGSAGEWLVERTPDGPVSSQEHRKADVAVRGQAEVLLLLLMRRAPAADPRLTIFGESSLLDHWLDHTAF